jgi:hypothetical protein
MRFVNADTYKGTITNSATLNNYAYANGNPISLIDPFGMSADWWGNGIQSFLSGANDFFQGFGSGLGQGISFGVTDKFEDYYNTQNEVVYLIGKTTGSAAMTVIDAYGTVISAGGIVITGPSGVGAVVCGSATAYLGASTFASFGYTVENVKDLIGEIKNSSGSSSGGAGKGNSLTDKPGKIANETGRTTEEVKQAIERVKQSGSWRNGANNRNPDVVVDTQTGEVYPKTPNGGIGDSIGNIYDYLP